MTTRSKITSKGHSSLCCNKCENPPSFSFSPLSSLASSWRLWNLLYAFNSKMFTGRRSSSLFMALERLCSYPSEKLRNLAWSIMLKDLSLIWNLILVERCESAQLMKFSLVCWLQGLTNLLGELVVDDKKHTIRNLSRGLFCNWAFFAWHLTKDQIKLI